MKRIIATFILGLMALGFTAATVEAGIRGHGGGHRGWSGRDNVIGHHGYYSHGNYGYGHYRPSYRQYNYGPPAGYYGGAYYGGGYYAPPSYGFPYGGGCY